MFASSRVVFASEKIDPESKTKMRKSLTQEKRTGNLVKRNKLCFPGLLFSFSSSVFGASESTPPTSPDGYSKAHLVVPTSSTSFLQHNAGVVVSPYGELTFLRQADDLASTLPGGNATATSMFLEMTKASSVPSPAFAQVAHGGQEGHQEQPKRYCFPIDIKVTVPETPADFHTIKSTSAQFLSQDPCFKLCDHVETGGGLCEARHDNTAEGDVEGGSFCHDNCRPLFFPLKPIGEDVVDETAKNPCASKLHWLSSDDHPVAMKKGNYGFVEDLQDFGNVRNADEQITVKILHIPNPITSPSSGVVRRPPQTAPPATAAAIVVKSQPVFPLLPSALRPIQLPWRVLNEINILENLPAHPHVVSLLGTRIGFGTGVPVPGEEDRTRSTEWKPVSSSSSFSTMKLPESYPSSARKGFSPDEINQVPHVHTLMPKLPGGTLSDRIKAPGTKIQDTFSMVYLPSVRGVLLGLLHLDDHGVVHRDLKPQNVAFLRETSTKEPSASSSTTATDTPHPVLLDFGMASIGENSDNGNDIVVEAYYRPPELRTKARDPTHLEIMQRQRHSRKVDIWGACVLFTRMLEMLFVLPLANTRVYDTPVRKVQLPVNPSLHVVSDVEDELLLIPDVELPADLKDDPIDSVVESYTQKSFTLLDANRLERNYWLEPHTQEAGPYFFRLQKLFQLFDVDTKKMKKPEPSDDSGWEDATCRVANWLSVEKDESKGFADQSGERQRCDEVCTLTDKAKKHLDNVWNVISDVADRDTQKVFSSKTPESEAADDSRDARMSSVRRTDAKGVGIDDAQSMAPPDGSKTNKASYLHTYSGLSRMISAYDGVSNMEIFGLPKYLEEDRQVKNPFFTGETANALYNFLRGGLRCHPDDRENIRGLIRLFNVLIDTYANNKEENHADDPARKEQILALKIPEDKLKKPTGSQQAINEKTKATMRKAVEEYQKARTDVENLSAEVKLEEARTAMKGAVSHELPVKTTAFNTAVKKVEDQVYKKGMEILYNIVRRSELGEGAGDGGGV